MKTIISLIMLGSLNASALTTVDVQNCARALNDDSLSELNGSAIYQSAGIDIYKLSPTREWGTLPKSVFKDQNSQAVCYRIPQKKTVWNAGRMEAKKKTELSVDERKRCEAHQITATRISKGELDYVLRSTLVGYAAQMNLGMMEESFQAMGLARATSLVRGFEKCESLAPIKMTSEFEEGMETAQMRADQLAKMYKIKRSDSAQGSAPNAIKPASRSR